MCTPCSSHLSHSIYDWGELFPFTQVSAHIYLYLLVPLYRYFNITLVVPYMAVVLCIGSKNYFLTHFCSLINQFYHPNSGAIAAPMIYGKSPYVRGTWQKCRITPFHDKIYPIWPPQWIPTYFMHADKSLIFTLHLYLRLFSSYFTLKETLREWIGTWSP